MRRRVSAQAGGHGFDHSVTCRPRSVEPASQVPPARPVSMSGTSLLPCAASHPRAARGAPPRARPSGGAGARRAAATACRPRRGDLWGPRTSGRKRLVRPPGEPHPMMRAMASATSSAAPPGAAFRRAALGDCGQEDKGAGSALHRRPREPAAAGWATSVGRGQLMSSWSVRPVADGLGDDALHRRFPSAVGAHGVAVHGMRLVDHLAVPARRVGARGASSATRCPTPADRHASTVRASPCTPTRSW